MMTHLNPDVWKIVAVYGPRLKAYCASLVGNVHTAEDIVQEVFIKLFETRPSFEGHSPQAWLYKVGKNMCLNHLEKNQTQQRHLLNMPQQAPAEASDELALKEESLKKLMDCYLKLSDRSREILHLRLVDNFSFQKIADALDKPKSSVAYQSQEALIKLNRCFHG